MSCSPASEDHLGLGALLSPFAALLPFVDPGLAEDANCAALLNERPVADASRAAR